MVRFEKIMRFIVCSFICFMSVIGIASLVNPLLSDFPTDDKRVLVLAILSALCFGYCMSGMIENHIQGEAKVIESKDDYNRLLFTICALNMLLLYCFQKGLMYFFFPEFKRILLFETVPLYHIVFWTIAIFFVELFRIRVYSPYIGAHLKETS